MDRGRKVDTGFKKQVNGSTEHVKEKSAGDLTKADVRKYHKNVKNLNKNYESLYGKGDRGKQSMSEMKTIIIELNSAYILIIRISWALVLKIDYFLLEIDSYYYFSATFAQNIRNLCLFK